MGDATILLAGPKLCPKTIMSSQIQNYFLPSITTKAPQPNDYGAFRMWCRHHESNAGPTDYKSVALPAELCRLTEANYIDVFFCRQQLIEN